MIRLFFLLLMLLVSVLTWTLKERPGLLSAAGIEFHWLTSFLHLVAPENVSPTVPEEKAPFVSESRSLSLTFEPVLKRFTSDLSVPTAHASVIVDSETGKVLFANKADEERPIASLTKLFTALIVVERIKDLNEPVIIDEEAVYAEGTRVGCPRSGFCNGVRLKIGEQISVHDLLRAALMNSANDAAIALGKHVGGSQAGFATIMNARGEELGLSNSHFCTPSGLDIDGKESSCYSSAADVAKIANETLKHPLLWDIMQLDKVDIASMDGQYTHELFNTDQLLGQMPNLVGTKTGFTPLAGYSLLAVATDPTGLHKVVVVVLNDPYRWQSIRSMFDWSFQSFDWI